jgi:guanylate kinase
LRRQEPGRLCVISGPSGVGKGTVIRALRRSRPDLLLSVSATTRTRRPGEEDGVHYHFLDDAAFDELVAADGLLEWAEFAGHRYGTPAAPVREALAGGRDVLLEIEVQGARQIRERIPESVSVFLAPPSLEELAERLRGRGTESEAAIGARLDQARAELAEAGAFDHLVLNDDVTRAAAEIARILDRAPIG